MSGYPIRVFKGWERRRNEYHLLYVRTDHITGLAYVRQVPASPEEPELKVGAEIEWLGLEWHVASLDDGVYSLRPQLRQHQD